MNLPANPEDCEPHTLSLGESHSLCAPCLHGASFVNRLLGVCSTVNVVNVWLLGSLTEQTSLKVQSALSSRCLLKPPRLSAWLTYTGTQHMCHS